MPKPTSQPAGVRRVRTIALILSVIVPKVWPGAMTGGSASGRGGDGDIGASDVVILAIDDLAICRFRITLTPGTTARNRQS